MYGSYIPTPERGVEVSIRGTWARAECPFCGEYAMCNAPPEGEGFWEVTKACVHCRGIYSAGRWDVASVTFKGPMVRVAECVCGERVKYETFTKHKKTAQIPSDHAMVTDTWVDRFVE